MNRLLVASVLVVGLLPGMCPGVEISNVHPRYGPYGAKRTDLKCLPKDVLVITYDITGLTVDAKSGKAKYSTLLELLDHQDKDAKGEPKVIFSKKTPNEPIVQLGGGRMPGDLFVTVGEKQKPGKYTIRLTVTDELEKDKNKAGSRFNYPYDVLAPKFGFAAVSAPAGGFPGTPYAVEFALINFNLDKNSLPRGDVNIRILDEKGTQVDGVKHILPTDLPAGTDLKEINALPFRHPIYLNRPGRFTVEIVAEDKNGNAKVELRYPFTVIDLNALQGK